MGSFYTNIALKGPTQEEVVAYLRRHQRATYVSPTLQGITVVYEHDCEAANVVSDLSRTFRCPALWAWVADSDVFGYALYQNGALIDQYSSDPDYGAEFYDEDDEDTGQDEQAGGDLSLSRGDARRLCAAFGADHAVQQVEGLLSRETSYVCEDDRHAAVAAALGLPAHACLTGYRYLEAEAAEGPVAWGACATAIKTGR